MRSEVSISLGCGQEVMMGHDGKSLKGVREKYLLQILSLTTDSES